MEPLRAWFFESPEAPAVRPTGSRWDGALFSVNGENCCAGYWRNDYAVKPGGFYAFTATACSETAAALANEFVSAFVTWKGTAKVLRREYLETERRDGSLFFNGILQAPEGAGIAELSLSFRWIAGTLRWSGMTVSEAPARPRRTPLVVTTKIGPPAPSDKRTNRAIIEKLLLDIQASLKTPDLIVLPENLLTRHVAGSFGEKAEAIPDGEFCGFLSKWARELRCHIYTTILERDAGLFYNTGVMLGRDGAFLGKYRKIHLTLSEAEGGVIPGSEYKVFDLDFGRVGVATCWDNWFPETARLLRLKGAELLIFPLAGDGDPRHWEPVWRTRALDNGLYLVASTSIGEDDRCPARIIDPSGEVVAEATGSVSFASARLDLDKKHLTYWLSVGPCDGEGRNLYRAERRPSTYGGLVE